MSAAELHTIETVSDDEREEVTRLRVAGGWVYQSIIYADTGEYDRQDDPILRMVAVAMVFVPDTPEAA